MEVTGALRLAASARATLAGAIITAAATRSALTIV